MKRLICIVHALILTLCLVACGSREAADTQTDKLSGTVSTDGSTSMEKVIGGLGEMFMERNSGITFLPTTPPDPVPASGLCRRGAAISAWHPAI